MPSYNPPISHYSQVSIPDNLEKKDVFKFIGKSGINLIKLTEILEMKYIWWDINRNVIELWGFEKNHRRACNKISHYLCTY